MYRFAAPAFGSQRVGKEGYELPLEMKDQTGVDGEDIGVPT